MERILVHPPSTQSFQPQISPETAQGHCTQRFTDPPHGLRAEIGLALVSIRLFAAATLVVVANEGNRQDMTLHSGTR